MRIGLTLVVFAIVMVCWLLVIRRPLLGQQESVPGQLASGEEDEISQILARVRADIAEHGWHMVAVPGEGRAGFLFTIGLWESFKHPEILVFATSEDPVPLGGVVKSLVKRISSGEKFNAGDSIDGAFGDYPARVRSVLPKWFASFLGTALGYYRGNSFPVVQLYWPDKSGNFPWHSAFDIEAVGYQPVLYQDNLVLAGVGYDEIRLITADLGAEALDDAAGDLFIPFEAAEKGDWLESWRWRVGSDVEIFRITAFGDLMLRDSDGKFLFLETSSNELWELADDVESWRRIIYDSPAMFFRARTLLQLRDLGISLEDGWVYDWITEWMLGGEESVDNIQRVSLLAHLAATGQLAENLDRGGDFTGETTEAETVYVVVLNEEEQYSIWPADQEVPSGWRRVGKTGSKQECLDYIEEVWVDMRPKSLREALEENSDS